MAVDVADIAANELIGEISKAAGLNLVDDYVAKGVEELNALAAGNVTPGIELAIERALFEINGGLLPYITLGEGEMFADMDALKAAAVAGDQDAADAYVFLNKGTYVKPALLEEAIAAAESDALQVAFGKMLGGFYGPGTPVGQKTEAELIELAKTGEYLGLRVAAATALTTYWILGSELTYVDVQNELLGVTLVYPELALAYQGFLAYLYSL
jgi:hypothetical protein